MLLLLCVVHTPQLVKVSFNVTRVRVVMKRKTQFVEGRKLGGVTTRSQTTALKSSQAVRPNLRLTID